MFTRRRILAILPTSMGCYRELIQGISSYGNSEGRWDLELCMPSQEYLSILKKRKPDGVLIGPLEDPQSVEAIMRITQHAVGLCGGFAYLGLKLATVESDDQAVGILGAQMLLNKGFRHFGFVGQAGDYWSDLRQQGFVAEISRAGHDAEVFKSNAALNGQHDTVRRLREEDITVWIARQKKPMAILACNDNAGRKISRCCAETGMRVPDDVAILGVDNDDLTAAITNPPLSSVIIPWREIGRLASAHLDQLISGKPIGQPNLSVPPTGIAERQSTGGTAIEDPQLRTAVRFIREHAGSQFTVDDIVLETGDTRRALERKFRKILGRSPLEEIRRSRIERASVLLAQSDLSIKQIAKQSGFGSVTWFTTAFRDIVGDSPATYRRRFRNSQ